MSKIFSETSVAVRSYNDVGKQDNSKKRLLLRFLERIDLYYIVRLIW